MSLSNEQRDIMKRMYQSENHGFSRTLIGLTDLNMSEEAYAQLWETTFEDYLRPFTSIDSSGQKKVAYTDDIFSAFLGCHLPVKMHEFAIEYLSNKTCGELLLNKEEYVRNLKREEQEINADYTENYGQKKDNFLKAVRYETDGKEIEFFFRYWRRPLIKLMTDRHVDLMTQEGKEEATAVLKDLFGLDTVNYDIMDLLQETPEHLVERKKEIETRRKELLRNKEAEKERLFDLPFSETLEEFIGIRFSDKTNYDLMAQEAYARPDAHEKLREFFKTKEDFDLAVFVDVLNKTPREISYHKEKLEEQLINRLDNAYLTLNPDATFGQFLQERRPDITMAILDGERTEKQQKALQFIIQTDRPVDNKAVKEAENISCYELHQNREEIVKKIHKRRMTKRCVIIAGISALLAFGSCCSYKVIDGICRIGQNSDPKTQQASQTKKETVAPVATEKVVRSAPETQQPPKIEKQPEPKSQKEITKEKGNRQIFGNWEAFQDINCTQKESGMFQQLLISEFNYLVQTLRTTNRPLYQTFDIEQMGLEGVNENGLVKIRAFEDEQSQSFYVKKDTRDIQNLKSDIINYHKNIWDFLDNLSDSPDDLAKKQLLALEAIGPSMGWSIRQQRFIQQKNSQMSQEAHNFIVKKAEDEIKRKNADRNDLNVIFESVMHATKSYRYIRPECNFLLLSADGAIREIAGMEKPKTKQLEQTSLQKGQNKSTASESQKVDVSQNKRETPKKEKESSYPWLWIIGTAALTSYLGSEYWKGKAEIVK